MPRPESVKTIEMPRTFVDVLYLTCQGQMPPEIKRLLKQKKLSSMVMGVEQYHHIRERLDLIGTVVVDAEGLDGNQQHRLAGIIESLEMESVGVVVLTNRVEMPIKSFSLSPAKTSFSMAGTMESVSIDDLWVRISVNLAYRKRSSGIAVKSPVSPKHVQRTHRNKLAEQLRVTEALVENLTEQLRLAGLVQQDFLPTQLPNTDQLRWATVFLPAEWVSGDIYNVVRVDEEHIGFYIADVVGHGMPAALLTIFLKQALVMRETVDSDYCIFCPAEVMKSLNVRLTSQKLSGYQFATCCYCLLNTKTLEMTFARGGHPYPILIRPGQPPEQLELRGPLLGIFEEAEYVQRTVQLEPGDRLLLYSDGAERFVGDYDDETGFRFSEDFHSLSDISVVETMDKLNAWAQDQRLDISEIDDITAVGLQIL